MIDDVRVPRRLIDLANDLNSVLVGSLGDTETFPRVVTWRQAKAINVARASLNEYLLYVKAFSAASAEECPTPIRDRMLD